MQAARGVEMVRHRDTHSEQGARHVLSSQVCVYTLHLQYTYQTRSSTCTLLVRSVYTLYTHSTLIKQGARHVLSSQVSVCTVHLQYTQENNELYIISSQVSVYTVHLQYTY